MQECGGSWTLSVCCQQQCGSVGEICPRWHHWARGSPLLAILGIGKPQLAGLGIEEPLGTGGRHFYIAVMGFSRLQDESFSLLTMRDMEPFTLDG